MMTLQQKEVLIRSWPFPWPELLALRMGAMTSRMKGVDSIGQLALMKEYEADLDRMLREHTADALPVRMFESLEAAQAEAVANKGRRMLCLILLKAAPVDEHER